MLIDVTCPHCQTSFTAPGELSGSRSNCPNPHCGKPLKISADSARQVNAPPTADSPVDTAHLDDVRKRIEGLFSLLRSPSTKDDSASDERLRPGAELGDFTIVRALASGGMGHVLLARQKSLGRLVALKVCRPEVAGDHRLRRRFETEAKALAQLRHQNVVPVLFTGEQDGLLYLAMEYIAGPSLADVLHAIRAAPKSVRAHQVVVNLVAGGSSSMPENTAADGPATLDRSYRTWVAETFSKVAGGLAAIHRAGIVHRDIKPANIVLDVESQPRIVDFGLARAEADSTVTQAGEFFGTPAYTSPEQARGDVLGVSMSSDVFSFGAALYESLSLRQPFNGSKAFDILTAIQREDPTLLRKGDPSTPWELEAIVDKCLQKQPGRRYASGTELAEDLQSFLDLRPIVARRSRFPIRIFRDAKRHPWIYAFFATLMALGVLVGVLSINARQQYLVSQSQERQRHLENAIIRGDSALFRAFVGARPTWLPEYLARRKQESIEAYSHAIFLNPQALWPRVQRGRVYMSQPETIALALDDFLVADAQNSNTRSIKKLIAKILQDLGRNEESADWRQKSDAIYPTTADDLYWLGVLARESGTDSKAASTLFSECILLQPAHYWARLERHHALLSTSTLDDYLRLVSDLTVANAQRPELPFASESLVMVLKDANRVDEALEQAEAMVQRFGFDLPRAMIYSDLLRRRKRFAEAIRVLQGVVTQDPRGHIAQSIADANFDMGLFDAATEWYEKAIAQGHRAPHIYNSLSRAFAAKGDASKAERILRAGLAEHSDNASMYLIAILWFEAQSRFEDAEEIYKKALDLPDIASKVGTPFDQTEGVILAYKGYHDLLKRSSSRARDRIALLNRALERFGPISRTTGPAVDPNVIFDLKMRLGTEYFSVGMKKDLDALVDRELGSSNRLQNATVALSPEQASVAFDFLRSIGRSDDALEIARLSEYANEVRMRHGRLLDGQVAVGRLVERGLIGSGKWDRAGERIQIRRQFDAKLTDAEYDELTIAHDELTKGNFTVNGHAWSALQEGLSKFPRSLRLNCKHVGYLTALDRPEEAWSAYVQTRDIYLEELSSSGAVDNLVFPFTQELTETAGWRCTNDAMLFTFLLRYDHKKECKVFETQLRAGFAKRKLSSEHLTCAVGLAQSEVGLHREAIETLTKSAEHVANGATFLHGAEHVLYNALIRSNLALEQPREALKWADQSLRSSNCNPESMFKFLMLAKQTGGSDTLADSLQRFGAIADEMKTGIRVMLTRGAFSAWLSAKNEDVRGATILGYSSCALLILTIRNEAYSWEEMAGWVAMLRVVMAKYGDTGALRILDQMAAHEDFPKDRYQEFLREFSFEPLTPGGKASSGSKSKS